MTTEQATQIISLLQNIELFIFIIMGLKITKLIVKLTCKVIKKIKEN